MIKIKKEWQSDLELAAEAWCDDGSSGGIETRQQIKNMEKLKQSREWEEINFEGEEEEVERSKWEKLAKWRNWILAQVLVMMSFQPSGRRFSSQDL